MQHNPKLFHWSHFPSSSFRVSVSVTSTRTFLKRQHPRAPELPEPAASRWYSSSDLPAASSPSLTRSCSTAVRSGVKHHHVTVQTLTSVLPAWAIFTLQSISVESLWMTLCQSCSWSVTLFSSSWNMALSCSVTDSNCRRLTLPSRSDLSAFFRRGQTRRRSLGYKDTGWERPSGSARPKSIQKTH